MEDESIKLPDTGDVEFRRQTVARMQALEFLILTLLNTELRTMSAGDRGANINAMKRDFSTLKGTGMTGADTEEITKIHHLAESYLADALEKIT